MKAHGERAWRLAWFVLTKTHCDWRKPSLKSEQSEPIFPLCCFPESWFQDPRHAEQPQRLLGGWKNCNSLPAEKERWESFKEGLLCTFLCSQRDIFLIRALAVSAHTSHLLSIQFFFLFNLTSSAMPVFARLQRGWKSRKAAAAADTEAWAATCQSAVHPASRSDTFLENLFIRSDQISLCSKRHG